MRYPASLSLALLLLLFTGCEKDDSDPDNGDLSEELTDGFCIRFSDSVLISHEEIDYYDLSTHMIYLKQSHDFLSSDNWDMAHWPFYVTAHKELVYQGTLWPAWSSSIPTGTYINLPFWYPDYAIRIEHPSESWGLPAGFVDPDLRADDRIIAVLQDQGQYREGLALTLDEIIYDQPGELTFTFTVTNRDSVDYYILSPDKMGVPLFHYFTIGLEIYNESGAWLTHQLEVESPDPWDSWSMEWTDLLEGGDSITYTIHYPEFDLFPGGEYQVSYFYPGLRNVELDQIEQGDGRIWLGGIYCRSEITVQ